MDSIHSPFASVDRIVSQLQTQQHLRPHQTLAQAIERAGLQLGGCSNLFRQATEGMRLDVTRKIGRLKSCELTQLARMAWRLGKDATARRSVVAAAS